MNLWLIRNRERFAAVAAASAWAAPLGALAVDNSVSTPSVLQETQFTTFEKTVRQIFNIVITVAGIAFVVLFLIGGIQYLTAAGNDETSKKARQLMLDAVIGIVIVVTAWAVGTYVLRLLGLTKESNAIPTTVVQ